MKQLRKSDQVLCSRCREFHFPSVDAGARDPQLAGKGSLGKPGIFSKTLDVV